MELTYTGRGDMMGRMTSLKCSVIMVYDLNRRTGGQSLRIRRFLIPVSHLEESQFCHDNERQQPRMAGKITRNKQWIAVQIN